ILNLQYSYSKGVQGRGCCPHWEPVAGRQRLQKGAVLLAGRRELPKLVFGLSACHLPPVVCYRNE
ncbi:MAG: hypothetical protein ACREX1_10960, partial [Advenella sp.]